MMFGKYVCQLKALTNVFIFSGVKNHFQFYNTTLHDVPIKGTIFNRLQNKNLTIVGDSIQLQLFEVGLYGIL